MNKVFFTIIFFFLIRISFSQAYNLKINFENNAQDTLIKIDTSNHSNIWQIGKPQKVFFDSAFSKRNAIVTDTINFYPMNNTSSFTLKIWDVRWNIDPGIWISFYHKYETDSLKDGGFVELSGDGGKTWGNIDLPPYNGFVFEDLYSINAYDTISGGIPALSGKSDWKNSAIGFCAIIFYPTDSIFLRFNFKSDPIQTNKEGWIIDDFNIYYGTAVCTGVNEIVGKNNFTSIIPNPFINESILEFTNQNDKLSEVEIYNSLGEKIQEFKNISDNQLQLSKNNFSNGLYFYKIKTKNNYSESGKFVIQ